MKLGDDLWIAVRLALRGVLEQAAQLIAHLLTLLVVALLRLRGMQEQVQQVLVVAPEDFHAGGEHPLDFYNEEKVG